MIKEVGLAEQGWTGCSGEHIYQAANLIQSIDWCLTNIGSENYQRLGYDFWFKRPQDATMFTLKWS